MDFILKECKATRHMKTVLLIMCLYNHVFVHVILIDYLLIK